MSDGIELVQQESTPVISVRTQTTMENLPLVIGRTYMEIMGHLNSLGIQPTGAPYTAYHNLDMSDLDVEMGFPIPHMVASEGNMVADTLPACSVASYMYKGPYSGMEPVYNEIFKWIEANGHQPTGVYYEYYYNSPAEVPEQELLTRVVIPLV